MLHTSTSFSRYLVFRMSSSKSVCVCGFWFGFLFCGLCVFLVVFFFSPFFFFFLSWWLNNISYWIRHEDFLLQASGNLIFISDIQQVVWAWVSLAHFAIDIFPLVVVAVWMKVLWGRDCSLLSIRRELSIQGAEASIRLFSISMLWN